MLGVTSQVAIAATMTTPSEIAVFWTTESTVIGPVETGAGAYPPCCG